MASVAFERTIYKGRTSVFDLSLTDRDGNDVNADTDNDTMRFKLGRRNDAVPLIDIDTSGPNARNSGMAWKTDTKVTITISQADTDLLEPGVYMAELFLVDDSVASPSGLSDPAIHPLYGTVHVVGLMAGDRGLT